MEYILSIDIGGSAVKYGVIDDDLNFLERGQVKTPRESQEALLKLLEDIYLSLEYKIYGVAVSMPGFIDTEKGYARTGGALVYNADTYFADILSKRLNLPVVIANDAKAAAKAEITYGSLREVQDGAVIVLGTGIGGALVLGGHIRNGSHFTSGEFSFVKTDRNHPLNWHAAWSSINGISGLLSRVYSFVPNNEEYTGEEIFDRANSGDENFYKAVDDFAMDVALQIFNLHCVLDLEKFAIGGGISQQDLLIELINNNYDRICLDLRGAFSRPEIERCKFSNDSNLIGAMVLAKERIL